MDPAYATRRPPQLNGGFDEQRPRTIIVDDVLCVAVAFGRGRQHCARCRESELLRRAGVLAGILAEPEASGGHWIQIGDLRLVGDLRSPSEAVAVPLLTCFRCHPSSDQLTAYVWVVELAEASWHLLYEFAERYELSYVAQPSDDLDARDGQP